jgi:CHAT domain-containing protein
MGRRLSWWAIALFTAGFCVIASPSLARVSPIGGDTPAQEPIAAVVQTAQSPVAQGRSLYEAGRYAEAAQVLEQAIATYRTGGDRLSEAVALGNLALTYLELGQISDAEQGVTESLEILRSMDTHSPEAQSRLAQVLMIAGRVQLTQGQSQQAYDTWTEAANWYEQAENTSGWLEARVNQAQAMQDLGFYQRAVATLSEVRDALADQPDSLTKAIALRSLGDTLRVAGDLQQSRQVLESSLAIAKQLNNTEAIAATQISLGNTLRAQVENPLQIAREDQTTVTYDQAIAFYQAAATAPVGGTIRVQALLNQLSLQVKLGQTAEAQAILPIIAQELQGLTASRTSIYQQIDFATNLVALKQQTGAADPSWESIADILARATQQAETLGDLRAQSYAVGSLGELYEYTGDWSNAYALTEQAWLISQTVSAPDIAYRWQWQLGRILQQQQNRDGAIAAYSKAVDLLQEIRGDLVASNRDAQFSFKEEVEPVYREFVTLLLQPEEETTQPSNENLSQARDVIEKLQVAELDNFFRSACLNVNEITVDDIDAQAAVFYPIILSDRLSVILSLPGQPLQQASTFVSKVDVENTITQLARLLRSPTNSNGHLPYARSLYDWLVRPFEAQLASADLKTLVFVPDGILQSIPMATLYDGEHYLIQNYAIAITPGLQLLETRPLEPRQLSALKVGLSQQRPDFPNFSALPGVVEEINIIQEEVPEGEVLLDEKFTTQAFSEALNRSPFPVVHLATHGKFGSRPEETFILTWDGAIDVNELRDLLQSGSLQRTNPVELLVFSACETATGDPRSALGLAGVAVGAGARSTVASLWQAFDESTVLFMQQFYEELSKENVTKAEALRQAQLAMLEVPIYQRPYFWSLFVLVGNWL